MSCSTPRSPLWRRRLAAGAAAPLLALPPPVLPQAAADFDRCVGALRSELKRHPDVRAETFDTYTRGAADLRADIEKFATTQPEFKLQIWDYLTRRVDAQRIEEGRELQTREAAALDSIRSRYGVDGATTVAVFGIETDYGRVRGRYPVIDATMSRACLNLASTERKNHFFAALWLLQEGLVKQEEFRGSWAGAFGKTQFMPGTFMRYMADGDGSGSPDIINSVADALATTARYLGSMGWQDNLPWGVEVKLPNPLPAGLQELNAQEGAHGCLGAGDGSGACRNWAQWSARGLTTIDGRPLSALQTRWPGLNARTQAALLMPAGPGGPAWLVTPNYQAIWRYNRADAYALAIGLLSDALRGDPPQSVPWPTDDPGISRAEVRELQTLLRAAGHCDVTADGSEGPLTSAAIRAEEARRGWPESGRAGARVLQALREAAQAAALSPTVVAAEPPMSAASAVEPSASAVATPEVAASSPEAAASAVAAEPAASAVPGDAAGSAVVAGPAASAAVAQDGAVAGAEPAASAVAATPAASVASVPKLAEGCPAPAASAGRQ